MLTFIIFILVLSVVVVVHEWGHFMVARLSGMRVFEFGWGFPPRMFGFYRDPVTKKWVRVSQSSLKSLQETVGGGERVAEFPATVYSINWLPLGGFVKIKGENGEDAIEPDSFTAQPAYKKLATLLAGVVMNFVLAAVLLSIGFMIGLPADLGALTDNNAIIVKPPQVMIQHVEAKSPAEAAQLKTGDIIRSIDAQPMNNANQVMGYVHAHATQIVKVEVQRGQQNFTKEIKPVSIKSGEPARLGIALADAGIVRFVWYRALYKGVVAAWFGLLNIFISFYILIRQLVLGQGLAFSISGPVGIAVAVGESARLGFNYLLNVTAMISLSLAALNVLPIPALDGGRVLFVIIERVTGKKVPAKYEQIAHTLGFVALMALIIVVTWRDVAALF